MNSRESLQKDCDYGGLRSEDRSFTSRHFTEGPEVSSLLCKRPSLHTPPVYRTGIRPSKMMLNWLSAAFQSLIGIVHFWLIFRSAK